MKVPEGVSQEEHKLRMKILILIIVFLIIFVVVILFLLSSIETATAQTKAVIGGFGTISPTSTALFAGLTGSKIGITTSYYGQDLYSLDLTINKLELVVSGGGRAALMHRDKSLDFVSMLFMPELYSTRDWVVLGLFGINFNTGPGIPKEIKQEPVFGIGLTRTF